MNFIFFNILVFAIFISFINCNFVNYTDKMKNKNNLNKQLVINPSPNLYNIFSSTSISNMAGAINSYIISLQKIEYKNNNINLINYNNLLEDMELCIISTSIRASLKNYFIFENKEYYIYSNYIIWDLLINLFVCICFFFLKNINIKDYIRILFFLLANYFCSKGKIINIFILKIFFKLIGYFIIKFLCSKFIKYNKILNSTLYGFISVIFDNYIEKIL
jgi:hypothetical protein